MRALRESGSEGGGGDMNGDVSEPDGRGEDAEKGGLVEVGEDGVNGSAECRWEFEKEGGP